VRTRLQKIDKLTFVADEVDRLYPPRCSTTSQLKKFIVSVFGYVQVEKMPVERMPVLVLNGFKYQKLGNWRRVLEELDDEPQKFPDSWNARIGRDKWRVEWGEQIEHWMGV